MSAIVAYASPRADPADEAWLVEATQLSRRAGPDGSSQVELGRAGLGHSLLQTGGEVQGPLTMDGRTWISAVARLDARRDLVAKLPRNGPSRADANEDGATLLLRAYDAWGEDLVEHVTGDFAFALWDGETQRLICVRDQLGVVPLHYAVHGGQLLVASALEALLAHPGVSDDLNRAAILDFLALGNFSLPQTTAFSEIHQLPPAHRLIWTPDGLRLDRYWQLPGPPELRRFGRTDEAAAVLQGQLELAVADRLSPGRLVTQLSGGMDSTSVASTAVRLLGERRSELKAVSGQLGGQSGDPEGELAREVAAHLEIPIEVLDASLQSPIDPLAPPGFLSPEPVSFSFTDFPRRLAALQSEWAPVSLSGHGGDSLFAFVPWYWIEWLRAGYVSRLSCAVAESLRITRRRPAVGLRPLLGTALQTRARPGPPPWLALSPGDWSAIGERAGAPLRGLHPSSRDARSLAESHVWGNELRRGDPALTGLPVRFRFPFADLRLIELIRSLAPDPWLVNKRLLRAATANQLPDAIRRRPKTPLGLRPPTGVEPDRLKALAEIVASAPGLDSFVDRSALRLELQESGGTTTQRRYARERALGLAYWLWHRQ